MEQRVLRFLGTAAQHILHALRRAIVAIALTALITFLVVAVATIVAATFLTGGHFPPDSNTYLAAAVIGIAFAYGAAVTVAFSEILIAIVRTIELLVKESEKVAEEAFKEAEVLARKAEQEAVHLGQGALHDVEGLGHGAAGVLGGVASTVGHDAHALEQGVASHLPGHHHEAAQ